MKTTKRRSRDPEGTKADILEVATREFADRGLHGARVNTIADRTRTSKRGIYYYFGGKQPLYTAVLERAYLQMEAAEQAIAVHSLNPRDAIRTIVEFTFDYFDQHPEFIRLVITENVHGGKFMSRSKVFKHFVPAVLGQLEDALTRGRAANQFPVMVDSKEIYLLISSLCFYRVAGQHTFDLIYKASLNDPESKQRQKQMLTDIVLSYLERRSP